MRPHFPGTPPSPPDSGRPGGGFNSLAVMLAGVCLALGAMAAWGLARHHAANRLQRERDRLVHRNWEVENAYAAVLARRNDFANFMIDSRTRVYRVPPGITAARALTVAWQDQTRTGFVIADTIQPPPHGQRYAVWFQGSSGWERAGIVEPERGMTCAEFSLPQATGDAQGFEIRLEIEPGAPGRGIATRNSANGT